MTSHFLLDVVIEHYYNIIMKIYNHIPINKDIWQDSYCYHYLTHIYLTNSAIDLYVIQDLQYFAVENPESLSSVVDSNYLNIDKRTFNKIINIDLIEDKLVNEFLVMMPREVWERLQDKLVTETLGIRGSICRVYVYLYYWAMRFQGSYSHPRELMVEELKMSNTTLARCISWLEEHELITRSEYSKRVTGRYSRRYYIPQEDWNYQCLKEYREQQDFIAKD